MNPVVALGWLLGTLGWKPLREPPPLPAPNRRARRAERAVTRRRYAKLLGTLKGAPRASIRRRVWASHARRLLEVRHGGG